MNNHDIKMVPMSPKEPSLEVNEDRTYQKSTRSFGRIVKKDKNSSKSKVLLPSNKPESYTQTLDRVSKSLKQLSCTVAEKDAKFPSLINIAYYTLNEKRILVSSIPKKHIFDFGIGTEEAIICDNKIKKPLNKFQLHCSSFLLSIAHTSVDLEEKTKKKIYNTYNYQKGGFGIDKSKLHIKDNSIIYTNGDLFELSTILEDLTSGWNNSLCVYSTKDLMNASKLEELKKNEDLNFMLENSRSKGSYNFSIFVNSVMPQFKTTKYLNFFNIPKGDLEKIDIRDLKSAF